MPIPDAADQESGIRGPVPEHASICLSDLHLTDADSAIFKHLAATLRAAAERGDNIFLLGDLCEVWVGDDDDGPLACAFRSLLAEAATKTWVGLMHGNRDFLFGEQLAADTGVALLPDPFPFGANLLLSHGDQYCIDDQPYQQMRTLFRSPEWQASVLAQSLDERRQLAADLRRQSSSANANKAQNIMDVNAGAVREAMQSSGCRLLLHGHTHRPGWHRHSGFDRLVLGDWEHIAWVAHIEAGASLVHGDGERVAEQLRAMVALHCLPLTA